MRPLKIESCNFDFRGDVARDFAGSQAVMTAALSATVSWSGCAPYHPQSEEFGVAHDGLTGKPIEPLREDDPRYQKAYPQLE
jgi:hypothetical protein